MDYIYGWIRQLVFFYILMTAILHLLPDKKYQKYVRFFCGMVLAILLVSPVLKVIGKEEDLMERISFTSFWQEMDGASLDLGRMEEWQRKAYTETYEDRIAQDIAALIPEEYSVKKIQVTLSEQLQPEEVEIKIVTTRKGTSAPDQKRLTEKLMNFYLLEEEQIKIYVQEG